MAQHCRNIFGDRLLVDPLESNHVSMHLQSQNFGSFVTLNLESLLVK